MTKKEQKDAAMDQLFGGLTNPSSSSSPQTVQQQEQPSSSELVSISPRQKKYKEENERVCTIVNVELMNKARYIAGKEGLPIRDIFEYGLKYLIKDYESKNGPIHTRKTKAKKGDASKVFDV